MKVKWEQFAKRRKINLEMFKNMSYMDYCSWCENRKVEPALKELYESARIMVVPAEDLIVEKPIESNLQELDEKQLKKLKKTMLEKLCSDLGLEYSVKDTKKKLIQKLLHVNN